MCSIDVTLYSTLDSGVTRQDTEAECDLEILKIRVVSFID